MLSLFSWSCSFYEDSTKCWKYGKLHLYLPGLIFIEPKSNQVVHIPFNAVLGIEKGKSSFIYPCILFKFDVGCLYFASFINRGNVFNIIHHFWNDLLLESDNPDTQHTLLKPEKDLLQIALDIQSTLSDAAVSLHNQGKQLDRTVERINYLHNDLAVSTRITRDLESWFGAFRLKETFVKENVVPQRDDYILCYADKLVYNVLVGNNAQEGHFPGSLAFVDTYLKITNEKSDILFVSSVQSISQINFHSPYDATFKKHIFGKPDLKVHLISSSLPRIMYTLEKTHLYHGNYDDPRSSDSFDPKNEDVEELILKFNSLKKICENLNHGEDGLKNRDHAALQISSILTSVKSMALEISLEQDAQIKQIDALSASVDKASHIVINNEKRVKKMT